VAALSFSTPNRSTAHPAAALAAFTVFCAGWSAFTAAQEPPGEQDTAAPQSHADVRAQTRIVHRGSTAVTEAQAAELTLTLTEAAMRPVQTWVRTAGSLDKTGHLLTAFVRSPDADQIAVGQRVRSFSVVQRTQMYQAKITGVTPAAGGARIEATVAARAPDIGAPYLMEIVVEQGPFLSVPNASIIEEGADKVVYVREASGAYAPRTIHTGIEGELYTQVLDGLAEGDQIVSIGSFFVDADNKLKGGSE
jgi:hypothetical protein